MTARDWFEKWFSKKCESDYLFPKDQKEWLWLAFKAGLGVGNFSNDISKLIEEVIPCNSSKRVP